MTFCVPETKKKNLLQGSQHESLEHIQSNVTTILNGLSENNFQQHFQAWQRHWNVCMKSEGKFFEGDNTH
jgi:hypothetical protein